MSSPSEHVTGGSVTREPDPGAGFDSLVVERERVMGSLDSHITKEGFPIENQRAENFEARYKAALAAADLLNTATRLEFKLLRLKVSDEAAASFSGSFWGQKSGAIIYAFGPDATYAAFDSVRKRKELSFE